MSTSNGRERSGGIDLSEWADEVDLALGDSDVLVQLLHVLLRLLG